MTFTAIPDQGAPPIETDRAVVLGEFGGFGLPIRGHTWHIFSPPADTENDLIAGGYPRLRDTGELVAAYLELMDNLKTVVRSGLSAAVYVQITDIEGEVNGYMTYDRAIIKFDDERVRESHRSLYELIE